jgi:tetratricopeptide (TPR) repeat protein
MAQITEPSSGPEAKAGAGEVRPGRRNLFKREARTSGTKDALSHVIAYLGSLQSHVENEEQQKRMSLFHGLTLLQARRLRRTGSGPAEGFLAPYHADRRTLELLPPSTSAGEFAEPAQVVAEAESLVVAAGGASGPSVAPFPGAAPGWLSWSFLLVLLLGTATFFLFERSPGTGREHPLAAPGPAPAAPTTAEGVAASDAALKTANAVIEAIAKGDLGKASALLVQAQSQGINLPGMRYQAALLALTLKDLDAADSWIEQSIKAKDSVSDCLYLRAVLDAKGREYGRSTLGRMGVNYELAAADFGEATRYTPFNPRNFFFQAECLRRNGNPVQAISCFEQALRCRPSAEDAELINFKMKLAELEGGTDPAFQTQLAAKLAQDPVAGSTLLLAAANEISQGNQKAALEYVHKAAAVMPAGTLSSRLRDFSFKSLPRGNNVTPASLPARPAAAAPAGHARTIIDPATQSMQLADPANW